MHLKDKVIPRQKANVVYEISCKNCPSKYIGETGRLLDARLKEHRKDVREQKELSHIAMHVSNYGHTFDFDNAAVLHVDSNYSKRKTLESYYTCANRNSINRTADVCPQFKQVVTTLLEER